jgi:hypothetical protein
MNTNEINEIIEILKNLRIAMKDAALNGGITEYTIKTGQSTIITRRDLNWLQKQYDYWYRRYNYILDGINGNIIAIRDELNEV